MRYSNALALAALVGASVPATGLAQAVGDVGIPIGSTPQRVIIEDLAGSPVDLSGYNGAPVLFEFWATWCENCAALLPQMERVYHAYRSQIEFVAIAVGVGQSARSIKRHLSRHPSAYRYLFDRSGRAVQAFMAPTTSFIVVMDEHGVVTYTGVGPDQDIEAAVNTALH